MSHHHNLHDSPLQEAGSTGLNKLNLPSKLTPGKQHNLAPNFDSSIGRSVSILRPGERLTHFFTKENPQVWFTYFNSLCDRDGLLDNQAKIDALVLGLDSNTFLSVQPLLDGTHCFGDIKDFLVNKFARPLDQQLQELLRIPSLGDLKPSDFLEQAHLAVSRDDMSDAVLCKILMMKLPTEVQTTLSIILGSPLNEFAAAADTAMRRFSAQLVSSINSSTPPFSQNNHEVRPLKFEKPHNLPHSSSIRHNRPRHNFNPSRDFGGNKFRSCKPGFYRGPNRLCFYHARFGRNARKCVAPCNWKQGN